MANKSVLGVVTVGFRWNRDAGAIAWVNTVSKQARMYFNPKYWREFRYHNYYVNHKKYYPDETDVSDIKMRDMLIKDVEDEIDQIPEVISHETVHLLLQKIHPWEDGEEHSASKGWDNRDIFGYASTNGTGCDTDNLEEYIKVHTPIPLPDLSWQTLNQVSGLKDY